MLGNIDYKEKVPHLKKYTSRKPLWISDLINKDPQNRQTMEAEEEAYWALEY